MKKIKKQNGITLIVLLITIIILLILAVVVVASIEENNIIEYAGIAVSKHNKEQLLEKETIKDAEGYLKEYNSSCKHENWKYTGNYIDKENDTTKHWIEKECKDCRQKIYDEDEGHFFISYDHGCYLCGGEQNRNFQN